MHQKIAKEMNLSETAFIRKLHPNDNFTQSKYTFFFSFKKIPEWYQKLFFQWGNDI